MSEKSADYFYNKATEYYEQKILNLAIKNFHQAIELNPKYPNAYYNLGIALFEKKEFDEAMESFQKALLLKPDDASCYSNLALLHLRKRDFEKAIEHYKKSLELNPDFGTYKDIGDVYVKSKDYDTAIEWYNKALEVNPCFIAAKEAINWALQLKGSEPASAEIVKTEPEQTKEDMAKDYFTAGVNCIKAQKLDEALANFRQCLKNDTNNIQARQFIDKIIAIKQKSPEL